MQSFILWAQSLLQYKILSLETCTNIAIGYRRFLYYNNILCELGLHNELLRIKLVNTENFSHYENYAIP